MINVFWFRKRHVGKDNFVFSSGRHPEEFRSFFRQEKITLLRISATVA